MTDGAVRKWHLDALETDVIGTVRADSLKAFTWAVSRTEPGGLILGDVGPIRFLPKEDRYETLVEPTEGIQVVILPTISHDLMLRGSDGELTVLNDIDEINAASSALSYEFFISSTNGERENCYQLQLGRESHVTWQKAALGVDDSLDLVRVETDIRQRKGKKKKG